ELRACEEPPAGVEPAPRPYEGRVLAVDTTEAQRWRGPKVETAGVETAPPRCKRGALPPELHPREGECGRVEANHHRRRRQGYSLLSSPMLSVREREGRPTGFEPIPRGSRPRMLTLTPQPPRTGTTGLEPAANRLTSECSGP